MTEFLFRLYYPKPGDEEEHGKFVRHIQEYCWWPTKEELEDESFQMMYPYHWRKKEFMTCNTMPDFWKVKEKKDFAATKHADKEEKKRKERNWANPIGAPPGYQYDHSWGKY